MGRSTSNLLSLSLLSYLSILTLPCSDQAVIEQIDLSQDSIAAEVKEDLRTAED
jgi:hypothetical protein